MHAYNLDIQFGSIESYKPIRCDLKHARHIYLAEYLTRVYANNSLWRDLSTQIAEISAFGSVLCKEKGNL